MKKILIIEDSAEHCEILSETLSFFNLTVKCMLNGISLFEVLHAYQPDLILMDYILPGQNGLELSKSIKTNFRFSKIPIILISAYNLNLHKLLYIDDFLPKPIDLYLLERKITAFLATCTSTEILKNDLCHFSNEEGFLHFAPKSGVVN